MSICKHRKSFACKGTSRARRGKAVKGVNAKAEPRGLTLAVPLTGLEQRATKPAQSNNFHYSSGRVTELSPMPIACSPLGAEDFVKSMSSIRQAFEKM